MGMVDPIFVGKQRLDAFITSSLYFPTKIGSMIPNCQKLCIKLFAGTVRIAILEKLNIDCITEKRNILKRLRAAVMLKQLDYMLVISMR